jgi:hypothetical protein
VGVCTGPDLKKRKEKNKNQKTYFFFFLCGKKRNPAAHRAREQ